jgi:hypothetical protein
VGWLFDCSRRDAFAMKHVDQMAVGGKFIYKGRCQIFVLKELRPFIKAQVGSDDRRLFSLPEEPEG